MPDNITFEQPISFNKELCPPSFDDVATMNAYTPARVGAITNVGDDGYRYTSTGWQKTADATASEQVFSGTINDL